MKNRLVEEIRQRENKKRKKPMPAELSKFALTAVSSDSDTDDDGELLTMDDCDSDDCEESFGESDIEECFQKPLKEDVKDGDFVFVKYCSKRVVSHIVVQVLQDPNEYISEVKFLICKLTKTKCAMFVFPEKDDFDEIDFKNIILRLPKPTTAGCTNRTVNNPNFPIHTVVPCTVHAQCIQYAV